MPAPKLDLRSDVIELLLERDLAPGDRLFEARLAKALRVSRRPVRNALDDLRAEGLVDLDPQRGYILAKPLTRDVLDAAASDMPVERCYDLLAGELLSGSLPFSISETELVRRYGVAPATLRRALASAASDGWALRNVGYGWTFPKVLRHPDAYRDLMHFRSQFEPEGLRSIDVVSADLALGRLVERQTEMMDMKAGDFSLQEIFRRGCEFHETLAELSGNAFALDTLKRLNNMRRLFVSRSHLPEPDYVKSHSLEHLQILKLLRERNIEAAVAAMRVHLRGRY